MSGFEAGNAETIDILDGKLRCECLCCKSIMIVSTCLMITMAGIFLAEFVPTENNIASA